MHSLVKLTGLARCQAMAWGWLFPLGAALCGTLAMPAGRAQSLAIDPAFAPVLLNAQFDVQEVTLTPMVDGRLFAQGPFMRAGITTANAGLAVLNGTGVHGPSFVYTGRRPNAFSGRILPLADGRFMLLNQLLTFATGGPNYAVLLVAADGTISPGSIGTLLTTGAMPHLALAPDGRVIPFGQISKVNNLPCEGLARLNADGTPDTTFAPALLGPDTYVERIAIAPDGAITAWASLATGTTRTTLLARFRADGSRDAGFAPPPDQLPAWIDDFAVTTDGRVFIASGSQLIRVNLDNTITGPLPAALPELSSITRLLPGPGGDLLVEARLPRGSPYIWTERSSVYQLAPDGALVRDFGAALGETGQLLVHAVYPNGDLLLRRANVKGNFVVGFYGINSLTFTYSVVQFLRVAVDGTLRARFLPEVGHGAVVEKISTLASGGVLLSGRFDLVQGERRRGLARLRGDGTLDPAFAIAPDDASRYCLLAVQPDGRLLVAATTSNGSIVRRLLVDGTIDPSLPADSDLVAPTTRLGVQSLNILTVDARGQIIAEVSSPNPNVRRLALFQPNGALASILPLEFSAPVVEAQNLADGGLLLRGWFSFVDNLAFPRLARMRADRTLDPTYRPPLLPEPAVVGPLLSGGRALVNYGVARPVGGTPGLLRLSPGGAVDPEFLARGGTSFAPVRELADGSLLGTEDATVRRWSANGVPDGLVALSLGVEGNQLPSVADAASLADGSIFVCGDFTSIAGVPRTGLARLVPATRPGEIVLDAPNQSVVAGRRTFLHVSVSEPANATYQWRFNGVDLPGATSALLVLERCTSAQTGRYRVVVTMGGNVFFSNEVIVTVAANNARLANFSARSRVRPAAPPQIAGLVTSSPVPCTVLLRAIGRGLPWDQPLQSLPRPSLGLFTGASEIARDAGGAYTDPIAAVAQRVGAFPARPYFVPGVLIAADSALLVDLPAGVFTAQTSSADGDQGVALFEFYDAAETPLPGFVKNVSLRGRTAPGIDTLIGGFVVAGDGPLTLLVRVVGPELAQWHVPGALVDPQLSLFASAQLIATNDDGGTQTRPGPFSISEASTATGAFPLDPASKSAALVATLEPGAYTMHATGANASAGEVLLELYVVDE